MIVVSAGPIQLSIPVEIAGDHLAGAVRQSDRRVGRPLESAPAIAQQHRQRFAAAHDEVRFAVTIDIAHDEAVSAAREFQRRPGCGCKVNVRCIGIEHADEDNQEHRKSFHEATLSLLLRRIVKSSSRKI